jgi:hypothetical protein
MEDFEKRRILKIIFKRIVYQLDNGINSNFNEYKSIYDKINVGHNKSVDEIRKSFYQMAFCIEVRKTTVLTDIERGECDEFYDEFLNLNL